MSIVEALGVMIEESDLGYSHTIGNLFEQVDLPNSPNRAVRIRGYGGSGHAYTHNQQGPSYMRPRIQVLVRGEPEEYYTPENEAMALYYHLARSGERVINGHRILGVDPVTYPEYLQRDANYRVSYTFNVEIEEGRYDE